MHGYKKRAHEAVTEERNLGRPLTLSFLQRAHGAGKPATVACHPTPSYPQLLPSAPYTPARSAGSKEARQAGRQPSSAACTYTIPFRESTHHEQRHGVRSDADPPLRASLEESERLVRLLAAQEGVQEGGVCQVRGRGGEEGC